ncbi:MAG: hypothetical protein ACC707_10070 [Thiohalomonadales bacterium]
MAKVVRLTLGNRGSKIPEDITTFSDEFIKAKDKQWTAFHKRLSQEHVPADFFEVDDAITGFHLSNTLPESTSPNQGPYVFFSKMFI